MADSLLHLEGYSLFPLQYNCTDGFDIKFEYQRTIKREPGTVVNHTFFSGLDQPCTFQLNFWATGRDGIHSLLTDLYLIKGRLTPFWLPIPIYTLTPLAQFGDASSNIVIEKTGWSDRDIGGKRLYLQTMAGVQYTRRITSCTSAVGYDLLALFAGITPIIEVSEVNYMCLLLFGRLDIDEVEVKYGHTGFAEFTTNFIELPFEHPA